MATTTPRIGLTKPDGTDLVDIAVLNTNFDKIDSNIASVTTQATKPTSGKKGDLWWDTDNGTLYLYTLNANGIDGQWVAATSDPVNIGVVASQAERDAQYPTPAQGMSVYRTDLGVTQRYYGLFNASTNPGGRDAAGWWNMEKSVGLVPINASTANIAPTNSAGTANSMGLISFESASSISLNNVFSPTYKSYRVLVKLHGQNGSGVLYMRLRAGGSDFSGANYHGGGYFGRNNATGGFTGGSNESAYQLMQYVAMTDWTLAATLDVFDPYVADQTTFSHSSWNYDGTGPYGMNRNGMLYSTGQYDGLTIFASAGLISGTIQVFGYNG